MGKGAAGGNAFGATLCIAHRGTASRPDKDFTKAVRQNVRAAADPSHGVIGSFRLDDDDALAADFVGRFRAEGKARHNQTPSTEIFGFENGWFLAAVPDGLKLTTVTRPLIACGLGRMSVRAPLRTIHDPKVGHTKLAEVLPTRHCGGSPTWIVTAHDLNDSDRLGHQGLANSPVLSPNAAHEMLGPRFAALDMESIAATLRR